MLPPDANPGRWAVKEQYVGDSNDYRKYPLLRALADGGATRVGVCWMLTNSDGSSDGTRLHYLSQPERYRAFDPDLFDLLKHAAAEPDRRRLRTIEDSGAIPNAAYHNDTLPQDVAARAVYMETCHRRFADADLVFFDPDNGIDVPSSRIGLKSALKYVFLDELAGFYRNGKSVLIYQHRPQLQPMADLIAACHGRLAAALPGSAIWAFRAPHVVFFLVVHPDSPARLAVAAMEACSRWNSSFISGAYLGRAASAPG